MISMQLFLSNGLNLLVLVTPGEQPPSSMTPAIFLSHDKKSQLVIGGAGGVRIISATTQVSTSTMSIGKTHALIFLGLFTCSVPHSSDLSSVQELQVPKHSLLSAVPGICD